MQGPAKKKHIILKVQCEQLQKEVRELQSTRQVFYWVIQLCPFSGLAPVHTGNLRTKIWEDIATCSAAADGTREAESRPGQKIQDFMLVCVTDMQQLDWLPEHIAQALHILAKHGRHLVTAPQVVQNPAF